MTAVSEPRQSFSERLVTRLASRLERRGLSRRSFLVRSALVGSVLTVAPLRWALRPTSAYASICGDGARCDQGWTAFCCTINNGANTCPPGSYVAGWWKIDNSPFCQNEPRYIVDCNRSPGATCRCRCASGTCDQRRVCCNNFRYGQCNTQIPGVTEVVCRVVICTVPWRWDPACGTSLRTDNRTRTHNAPCLPGRDATPIDLHYQDLGQSGSLLGRPVAAEQPGPRSGAWRRYERGVITWRQATGPRVLTDRIAARYVGFDGPGGALGYPTSAATEIEGTAGRQVRFERGRIIDDGAHAFAVFGPALARYDGLGGATGQLGFPTDSTTPVGDGRGSVTRFEQGAIYTLAGAAQELGPTVAARYHALGGPVDSGLGYPQGPADEQEQRFAHGVLVATDGTLRVVRGVIARRYLELGGRHGPWGAPAADQEQVAGGWQASFEEVSVFAGPTTGAFALDGAVLAAYLGAGGPGGALGWPTSDRIRTRFGHDRASFEGGAIEVDAATGTARVLGRRGTRSASELS